MGFRGCRVEFYYLWVVALLVGGIGYYFKHGGGGMWSLMFAYRRPPSDAAEAIPGQ